MNNEETMLGITVRSLYDIQKLRIQMGNRVAGAFRIKLGLNSSDPEEADREAEKILKTLRSEFKRITDGVKRITVNFKSDSQLITTRSELLLIEAYERQLDAEASHEKAIANELLNEPLWYEYLVNVRGVGTLMAGVILSEIDIHKANSISALHAYCGLDVVEITDKVTGEVRYEGRCREKDHLVPKTYTNRNGDVVHTNGISFNPTIKTKMVGVLGNIFIKLGGPYREIYDHYKHRIECDPRHCDSWTLAKVKPTDKEEKVDEGKDSKKKVKQKEVILEVLRVIRSDEGVYSLYQPQDDEEDLDNVITYEDDEDYVPPIWTRAIFYSKEAADIAFADLKPHLPTTDKYKVVRTGKTPGHRHAMALRYMTKEFLADLWTVWRTLEDLPVRPPYREEKLGIIHSKPREIQEWLDAYHAAHPPVDRSLDDDDATEPTIVPAANVVVTAAPIEEPVVETDNVVEFEGSSKKEKKAKAKKEKKEKKEKKAKK